MWNNNEQSMFQVGFNKITTGFEFFEDLGGAIPDHVIRKKMAQKIIIIIIAIKFKT